MIFSNKNLCSSVKSVDKNKWLDEFDGESIVLWDSEQI